MLILFCIVIQVLSVDTLYNLPLALPFTFTVDSISVYEYLRVDPEGCSSSNFSLNFTPKDDYHIGGDILLSITFLRFAENSYVQVSEKKNNKTEVIKSSGDLNRTRWLDGRCLFPFEIHFTDKAGKSMKMISEEIFHIRNSKQVSFDLSNTLFGTKFITVDGSVLITNAHNIGIYTYHDKRSIQGPLPNIKIIDFPVDFILHERYSLILTVRPLWETRKNIVYIRIKDKNNRMEFAHVQLNYIETYKYEIYCSTVNSAGQDKRMNYYSFEKDNNRFNFPIRLEFVAMLHFDFLEGEVIELYINNVWYCTFEELADTIDHPARLIIEGESNHIALITEEWI